MALEATAPSPPLPAMIKSSQPRRAAPRRRRPTALRTSLLTQIGTRKGLGSDKVDLASQTRRITSTATKASPTTAQDNAKATREKRNRADDAENQVSNLTHDANANEASLLSPSDNSVIRYENDPCTTPPYKLLAYENRDLARRVDSLENENAALIHTRLIERERLSEINGGLIDKIQSYRQEAAYWQQQAGIWKGQMMDRDGEVQRLRMKLQELVGENARID